MTFYRPNNKSINQGNSCWFHLTSYCAAYCRSLRCTQLETADSSVSPNARSNCKKNRCWRMFAYYNHTWDSWHVCRWFTLAHANLRAYPRFNPNKTLWCCSFSPIVSPQTCLAANWQLPASVFVCVCVCYIFRVLFAQSHQLTCRWTLERRVFKGAAPAYL